MTESREPPIKIDIEKALSNNYIEKSFLTPHGVEIRKVQLSTMVDNETKILHTMIHLATDAKASGWDIDISRRAQINADNCDYNRKIYYSLAIYLELKRLIRKHCKAKNPSKEKILETIEILNYIIDNTSTVAGSEYELTDEDSYNLRNFAEYYLYEYMKLHEVM